MADDKLTYSIEVDDNATPKLKKVGQSFKAVDDSSKKMSATMVAQGVIIADAAKMIATKIYELGRAVVDEADSFGEFGRSIGVTTKEVAGLDRTFRLGGSSTEGMKAAMFALSAALDPEKITKQRKAVEDLGVSVTNEDGTYKTHLQLLGDIADAYKGEESASRRAALSRRIFGGESQKNE